MKIVSCELVEERHTSEKYDYRFIKEIKRDKDDIYVYEFIYCNSGVKLILELSSSESLWLNDKYLGKFDKFIDTLSEELDKYVKEVL